jgi:transcriptional regulator with GAF, ATPase, and Fis domain
MHGKQKPTNNYELDFVHRIAEHVANGDTFDETLASAIDFSVWLVSCDGCIAYVREGEQLEPWVWKHSGDKSIEQSKLPNDHICVRALSEHVQAIAVVQCGGTAPQVRQFSSWSTDPGETSVWIPFVAKSRLLGAMHLEHRRARTYGRHEIDLLLSIGCILGAEIRISQLESENSDLLLELETRKLVEREKGILRCDIGLSGEEAYVAVERQSRQKRRPIKEIAPAIILSGELERGPRTAH